MKKYFIVLVFCFQFIFVSMFITVRANAQIQESNIDLITYLDENVQVLDVAQKNNLEKVKNRIAVKSHNLFKIKDFINMNKSEVIKIKLPNGENYKVKYLRIEYRNENDFSWFGTIKNPGDVILTVKNDFIYGTIRINNELYEICSLGSNVHSLNHIDKSKFPPENKYDFMNKQDGKRKGASIQQNSFNTLSKPDKSTSTQTTLTYEDILVAYTPAANSEVTNMSTLIQNSIDESNQSFFNSNVDVRFNLVHSYQVAYTESGNGQTDLDRFAGTADGYMDEVHVKRYQNNADICVLIYDHSVWGIAGDIPADLTEAFCVVNWENSVNTLTFPHDFV